MHDPLSYYVDICQKLSSHMFFANDLHLPSRVTPLAKHLPSDFFEPFEEVDSWKGVFRFPSVQLSADVSYTQFRELWALNPVRTTLMMSLNVIRSLFPAFRGYSQAMIIDELQSLISSGSFTWSRLLYLISTEVVRRIVEALLDSLAFSNENVVLDSARFFVEREQLKHRVRLDVPTLADPTVRDLLQESDLFARSFSGGGFGLLSPLDFVHILSLTIEILSHIFLVISLTRGATHFGVLLVSILSAMIPLLLPWCNFSQSHPEPVPNVREAQAVERHERMRNLVYSDAYRPEIALFGLGDWILDTWSSARKIVLNPEQPHILKESSLLSQLHLSDLLFALQNIPLFWIMQTSAASLGSLTLYRSSIQSVLFACGNLIRTTKMAFQGIFLMSAFCASMQLKPRLQPDDKDMVAYESLPGGVGIDVRVNGVDVRRYHPEEYHRHLTAVFQGFSKFNATVRENVGLGHVMRLAEDAAVAKAVHLAEADSVVQSLPHGLRTKLETPGFDCISYPGMGRRQQSPHHGLSGGEWQRIAIARAFMRASQPEVDLLLFDEPTSSLDAHAQNQIFETIEKISRSPSGDRKKSVIFITHRLSTARRADKVAMMENGTISEFGTHQDLLSRNGSYAALYRASV
ncbi:hypothetical protein H0H81_002385 [Sphagnurus paluster]|uniref:ABC transporter domain-containing protein n=1 Tax=Sphagnurus paluster TaxID=117069 RepID=A0A9P7KN04_9AGAR|nr:hypothetical protein H0H81_002385 [Sphagnurus paluster]